MNTFLLYIIQSGYCLLLFYLGYKALLGRDTFFSFNRKVLIGGMLVCLLLPLIEVRTSDLSVCQEPFVKLDLLLAEETTIPYLYADSTPVAPELIHQDTEKNNSVLWLGRIYSFGLLIGLVLFISSFVSLVILLRKGKKIKKENYTLILTEESVSPFNWGRYIILSEADYRQEATEILLHEQAHLKKRHSLDIVFVELILLLHWFNPVVWLLRRELRIIHEYEADSEVLNNGIDATKYQLLLVKKAVSSRSYTFANSFNQSKLKNRITMMLKKKSNRQARWKLLLLVPMAVFALYAFARPDVNLHLQQLIPSEDTTISGDDQSFTREYFESRFDAYYDQRFGQSSSSKREKFDRLKEQFSVIPILLNAENSILVEKKIVPKEQLQSILESSITTKITQHKDQVLFYFLADEGASRNTVEQVTATLGLILNKYNSTDFPVLVYWDVPSNYPPAASKMDNSSIRVKVYDKSNKEYPIFFNVYDSYDVMKEKLSVLTKHVERVEISAKPDVPMGMITDIKAIIRDMYAKQGTKGHKVPFVETVL